MTAITMVFEDLAQAQAFFIWMKTEGAYAQHVYLRDRNIKHADIFEFNKEQLHIVAKKSEDEE